MDHWGIYVAYLWVGTIVWPSPMLYALFARDRFFFLSPQGRPYGASRAGAVARRPRVNLYEDINVTYYRVEFLKPSRRCSADQEIRY